MVLKYVYTIILMMIWRMYPLKCAVYDTNQAQLGCNSACGNVSIPFPFGMQDPNCFLNEWFEIECRNNNTLESQGEKPYLKKLNLEVMLIDIWEGMVWIKNPIYNCGCGTEECRSGNKTGGNIKLGGSPFVYSQVYNSFVAVGCQNYAFLMSENDTEVAGCMSMCDKGKKYDETIDKCRGTYCCETSLPSYLSEYIVQMGTLINVKKVTEGCAYALIRADYGIYTFHDKNNFIERNSFPRTIRELQHLTDVPAVLEWEIPNNNSFHGGISANLSEYARFCYSTSVTSSQPQHTGFRCRCTYGFEGNPYIQGSCMFASNKEKPWRNSKGPKWGIIGISSSLGTIILVLGLWWMHKVIKKRIAKKRKERFFKQNGGLLLEQRVSSGEVNVDKIKLFSIKDLEKATDRFNINRILGKGGQGTVYKGMLVDGKIVAVKKFEVNGKVEEFINEFVILSQINHRNVVKLLGCCLETEIPLLVYEFIPNGNLYECLHGQNEDLPMTWDMRLRIATEVGGALFYLHSAAAQPIYHRDIKSTNILLDEKYKAKVADFGSSRMVSIEATHLTTKVQGTFGYLDPEYYHTSQFTEKSDVYSFGVVLVELLTGQKPISSVKEQELKNLASYFLFCSKENRLFDIVDERVMKEAEKEHIIVVANLARRCLELSGKNRPTMKEVTSELESIQKLLKSNAQEQHVELERAGIEDSQIWAAYSTTSNSEQISDSLASTLEIMPMLTK